MESFRPQSISSLPIEILTYIFIQVWTMHLCPRSANYATIQLKFINHSVILSHVCSSWRRLAITSKYLWTHIDLVPSRFPGGRFAADRVPACIETFLARAGSKPLDIHFNYLSHDPFPKAAALLNLIQFITTVAPHAWGVTIEMPSSPYSLCSRVISTFIEHCVPGNLTHLSIKLATSVRSAPIEDTLMGQPQTAVEALWLPITRLKLHGFHPKWNSQVYHGLTELRLSGDSRPIPDFELVAILKASPKLRSIQISIPISEATPSCVDTEDAPVLLEDLEVLTSDAATGTGGSHTLIKLVYPGRKPLTLSVRNLSRRNMYSVSNENYEAMKSFLARSNVTRLVLTGFVDYLDIANLLALAPTIKVLAFERLTRIWVVDDESSLSEASTLDALYVTCSTNPSSTPFSSPTSHLIEQVIRRHQVSKLTLWCYPSDSSGLPDNFYTVCSQVIIISGNDPDPIQEWK